MFPRLKYQSFALIALVSSLFAKPFVTCDYLGQLGNQMFQTAAAISYALENGCEPAFPSLKFAINGESNCRYIFHRLNLNPFPENTIFLHHDHHAHNDFYAPIPTYGDQNVELHAHFSSEKYFAKHREVIQELFAPTQEIIDRIKEKYGNLFNEPTVAVHVRTFLPDHFRQPLNCPDKLVAHRWHYFIQALNLFSESTSFLIFSDDMDWTKKNFPRANKKITFIEGNPAYFDFYMMSLCDHQILSPDSTFSWWAAWLNRNPNKIVVIPDTTSGLKNSDFICEGWTVLPKF